MKSRMVSGWVAAGVVAALCLFASAQRVCAAVTVTGGTITTNGNFIIHTFTNVGDTAFVVSGGSVTCDVLLVAGGGSPHLRCVRLVPGLSGRQGRAPRARGQPPLPTQRHRHEQSAGTGYCGDDANSPGPRVPRTVSPESSDGLDGLGRNQSRSH